MHLKFVSQRLHLTMYASLITLRSGTCSCSVHILHFRAHQQFFLGLVLGGQIREGGFPTLSMLGMFRPVVLPLTTFFSKTEQRIVKVSHLLQEKIYSLYICSHCQTHFYFFLSNSHYDQNSIFIVLDSLQFSSHNY